MTEQRGAVGIALAWVLLLLVGVLATGCASFSDGAHRTKGAVAVALLTATQEWQTIDLAKQRQILDESPVREIWTPRIAAYRNGEQARATAALRAARHSLSLLSSALDAYDLGKGSKPDVRAAILAASAAAFDLVAVLQSVGVKIDATILGGVK